MRVRVCWLVRVCVSFDAHVYVSFDVYVYPRICVRFHMLLICFVNLCVCSNMRVYFCVRFDMCLFMCAF